MSAGRWMKVLAEFVGDLRIRSKEIVSDDPRGSPLVLWESQRRFMSEVGTGLDLGIRDFRCLKSRQLGATTLSLGIDVMWPAVHPGLVGALVTDTEKNRDANRGILESYINGFDEGYFDDDFHIVTSNRQGLTFSNGSRLDLLVAGTRKKSSSWGEGVGYAYVHCTEVASYGDPEGFASFRESWAQKNPNRLFLMESTAKGFNDWRDLWLAGETDPQTIRSFFIGWWSGDMNVIDRDDPRFLQYGRAAPTPDEREKIAKVKALYDWDITPQQLAWIRYRDAQSGGVEAMFAQNQPWTADEAFVASGYSFFQVRAITRDLQRLSDEDPPYLAYRYDMGQTFFDMRCLPVEEQAEMDLIQLRVWEEPKPKGRYVIGMDTAWGRNEHKDRTVIEVYRCFADCLVQVAEFATADMDTRHAAWVLAHLAGVYKDCLVNIEVNGPGNNIIVEWDALRAQLASDMYAERVRTLDWRDALGHARWYLYHRPDSMGAGYAYNTMATGKIIERLLHGLRSCYITGQLTINSRRMLHEMQIVVVHESGHIGARESRQADHKDDRVYASAYAVVAWQEWIVRTMITLGLTREVVETEERGEASDQTITINRLVRQFFLNAGQPKPEVLTWRQERGLS